MAKISVIIPTFNRADLLRRAIDSVITQTFQNFEIIVVDDGSTDNIKENIVQYGIRLRYFWQENAGVSAARNRGIRESTGEYVAFLDDDDFWTPMKLAIQAKILDENKNVGLVYAQMPFVDEAGEVHGISQESGNDFMGLLEKGGFYPPSIVMVRRECFEKAGFFDESLPVFEDFDMWLRIARFYGIYEIKEPILGYYFRPQERIKRDQIRVLEAKVKLHRKILRSYDDIPKRQLRIREMAKYLYMLSKAHYEEKQYKNAFWALRNAICSSFFVGSAFIDAGDRIAQKLLKCLKPYFFMALLFFLYIRETIKKTVIPKGMQIP